MEYFSKYKDTKSIQKYGEPQTHHTLSVVIPTYNKAVPLIRAIKSALNQRNVNIDYNIVIVENYEGDVGDTIKMISSIENLNNIQIVYYQNEKNIGMHPNWNRCFEMADADYVLMVHTDDYLLPDCIFYAAEAIRQNIPFLCMNRISFRPGDPKCEKRICAEKSNQQNRKTKKKIKFHLETPLDILIGIVLVAPTGFLAKKKEYVTSGGFCTKGHTWPADLELSFQLAEERKLYFCKKFLVVKSEGDGNDGSNLASTVPLVKYDKEVFEQVAKVQAIPFGKQIIGMRMAGIIKGFSIDYDQYMSDTFPKYYLNIIWQLIYKILCKIQRHNLYKR